ncbi:MAG TPA: hypothetical protein VHW02_07765 [Rhizomicrobium sp.]|jgi:hypothetical protein|nr:hypothetical protein [Rhizomicrobium sp.]
MTGTKGFWVRCKKCAHCWIVAYLPIEVGTFGKLCKRAACPKCGATKPESPKQRDGDLIDDAQLSRVTQVTLTDAAGAGYPLPSEGGAA